MENIELLVITYYNKIEFLILYFYLDLIFVPLQHVEKMLFYSFIPISIANAKGFLCANKGKKACY